MRRFHKKALDCCDPVDEEVLTFDFHGMVNEYCVILENLSFSSSSRLMEAIRRSNEFVKRTSSQVL